MFVKYAKASVFFPGGYGTMDELFESITLIQTGRIPKFPVILVGSEYWNSLVDWMKKAMLTDNRVEKRDLNIFHIVDAPEDVLKKIKVFYSNKS